jgi:hypothetical protein
MVGGLVEHSRNAALERASLRLLMWQLAASPVKADSA